MKAITRIGAALAAVCLMSAAALAADRSGTWTSTDSAGAGGGGPTLVLEVKAGQLSGTFSPPGPGSRSVKISAASISGDTIRFSVVRTVEKKRMVEKYSGRFEGDTIVGKVEGADGPPAARDWIARRSPASAPSG